MNAVYNNMDDEFILFKSLITFFDIFVIPINSFLYIYKSEITILIFLTLILVGIIIGSIVGFLINYIKSDYIEV